MSRREQIYTSHVKIMWSVVLRKYWPLFWTRKVLNIKRARSPLIC
jgi:hypothetical protein